MICDRMRPLTEENRIQTGANRRTKPPNQTNVLFKRLAELPYP